MSSGKEISVGEGQPQILHPFTTRQSLSSLKQFHTIGESYPLCLPSLLLELLLSSENITS